MKQMRSARGLSQGRGQHGVVPLRSRVGGTFNSGQSQRRGNQSSKDIDHDRSMEHIASVSRSGGLEKGGDLLKEYTAQEEFRAFIDRKLEIFWDIYGPCAPNKIQNDSSVQKKENQENILILFRKLREGLFASGRKDDFALEVYETSLYLSVIFDSPVQTTSILSRLAPDLRSSATPVPQSSRLTSTTCLISLLHQLIVSFPSQQAYLEQIKHLVPNLLECPSDAYLWISTLARSLRTLNFIQFERLSHSNAIERLLESSHSIPSLDVTAERTLHDLPRNAVHVLVSRLRLKARDKAWRIVRNAYRELSSSDESQAWLGKRLFFDNFGSEASVVWFDDWVREKCRDGHLRPKEGAEGRWIVCRAR